MARPDAVIATLTGPPIAADSETTAARGSVRIPGTTSTELTITMQPVSRDTSPGRAARSAGVPETRGQSVTTPITARTMTDALSIIVMTLSIMTLPLPSGCRPSTTLGPSPEQFGTAPGPPPPSTAPDPRHSRSPNGSAGDGPWPTPPPHPAAPSTGAAP